MNHFTTTAKRIIIVSTLIVLGIIALGVWWTVFRTEQIRLFAPVSEYDNSFAPGTVVFLDNDRVGDVLVTEFSAGTKYVELRLNVTSAQRRKLKEGLRRVVGTRAVALTTEFVDGRGVLLIDGDVVPPLTASERHLLRWGRRLENWLLPAGGAGVLLLLRWLVKRR
jgi:hypothetical protein